MTSGYLKCKESLIRLQNLQNCEYANIFIFLLVSLVGYVLWLLLFLDIFYTL